MHSPAASHRMECDAGAQLRWQAGCPSQDRGCAAFPGGSHVWLHEQGTLQVPVGETNQSQDHTASSLGGGNKVPMF